MGRKPFSKILTFQTELFIYLGGGRENPTNFNTLYSKTAILCTLTLNTSKDSGTLFQVNMLKIVLRVATLL